MGSGKLRSVGVGRHIASLGYHPSGVLFDCCFYSTVKDPTLYDLIVYSSYDDFAEDLICIVDEKKLKSSIFVGHSMPSMIGFIASLKRPSLFKKLVFIGASPRKHYQWPWSRLSAWCDKLCLKSNR